MGDLRVLRMKKNTSTVLIGVFMLAVVAGGVVFVLQHQRENTIQFVEISTATTTINANTTTQEIIDTVDHT